MLAAADGIEEAIYLYSLASVDKQKERWRRERKQTKAEERRERE
jgi:hypothetical protein